MEEQLISFETAKLAKEKGFLIRCNNYWAIHEKPFLNKIGYRDFSNNPSKFKNVYSAPTQSLLQKWLREKHKLIIWIQPSALKPESIFYPKIDTKKPVGLLGYNDTYEEALEKGLQEGLKLI